MQRPAFYFVLCNIIRSRSNSLCHSCGNINGHYLKPRKVWQSLWKPWQQRSISVYKEFQPSQYILLQVILYLQIPELFSLLGQGDYHIFHSFIWFQLNPPESSTPLYLHFMLTSSCEKWQVWWAVFACLQKSYFYSVIKILLVSYLHCF